jgi:L-asparaginase/Glu-tRNA(Gln) amidotransferase subunit D
MPHIVVIGTGGTLASRPNQLGQLVAATSISQLVEASGLPPAITVDAHDALLKGSYRLDLADQLAIVTEIRAALADDGVDGVVVTHGTDTLEETAFLADLTLSDPRPIVFTGAQRAGGADLVRAGAIPMADLRPSQARVYLAGLLATCQTQSEIRNRLALLEPKPQERKE